MVTLLGDCLLAHPTLSWKVTGERQVTFAVEAVAASQARDLAQEVCRWQGRVFLPLLHAVGLGSFTGELPPNKAQRPGVVVMELADSTLQQKKFEGDALTMVAWALASTLALLNEAGFTERNDGTPPLTPTLRSLSLCASSALPHSQRFVAFQLHHPEQKKTLNVNVAEIRWLSGNSIFSGVFRFGSAFTVGLQGFLTQGSSRSCPNSTKICNELWIWGARDR